MTALDRIAERVPEAAAFVKPYGWGIGISGQVRVFNGSPLHVWDDANAALTALAERLEQAEAEVERLRSQVDRYERTITDVNAEWEQAETELLASRGQTLREANRAEQAEAEVKRLNATCITTAQHNNIVAQKDAELAALKARSCGEWCPACVPFTTLFTKPQNDYLGCLRIFSDSDAKRDRAPVGEPCPYSEDGGSQ